MNQKYKELEALKLSPQERESLDSWADDSFVRALLDRDPASASSQAAQAIEIIREEAKGGGREAALTIELLMKLHNPADPAAAGMRKGSASIANPMAVVKPEQIPLSLESACRWFSVESFLELNPIEQASIALLRLIEIQPFEKDTERTAITAASLFTVRAGLPPLVIGLDKKAGLAAAIGEGMRMSTQPMVELLAKAVETTLTGMVALAGRGR